MTSLVAAKVDSIFIFIIGISFLLLLGITIAMVWFIIRYRRDKHPTPVHVEEKAWLEISWTVLPTLLVLAMFWFGYDGFKLMRTVPLGAMPVTVHARMWDWSFEYENGVTTSKLFVPVGKPVKLLLRSKDMIHGFYLPAFRVKEDVVPGKENYTWFEPLIEGEFDVFCSVYCGERHSFMMTKAVVVDEGLFRSWYDSNGALPLPGAGQ
jgi:cytochrome c oxidase subunit II